MRRARPAEKALTASTHIPIAVGVLAPWQLVEALRFAGNKSKQNSVFKDHYRVATEMLGHGLLRAQELSRNTLILAEDHTTFDEYLELIHAYQTIKACQ